MNDEMKGNERREYVPRCKICHKVMDTPTTFFEMDLVCPPCLATFSKKELAVMTELFNEFGDWFGKYEQIEEQTFEERVRMVTENAKNHDLSVFELNSLLIHWELTHGIRYNDHLTQIRAFLDENG
jgi:hypothetical protein